MPTSKLLDQASQRVSTLMRIANQCKVLETVVDSGIGLSMAGTDVLPEMEKAHWLIWDGHKDEV